MKRVSILTFLSAALLATAPLSAIAEVSQPDFGKAMDAYLSNDANVAKIAEAFQRYATKLQKEEQEKQAAAEKSDFETQFKNPIKVDPGKSPVKGNSSAKYTIVEFSDFQCPYCKRGADTMEQVLKDNANDVKLVFKHLPLPFHPEARPASKAAIAAGKQGKFWEMYAKLFGNQSGLSSGMYESAAKELGLNMDQFRKDAASPEVEAEIVADEKLAQSLGINGTPGFIVGGIKVSGARPPQYFQGIIDRLKNGGVKK